MTSTIDLAMGFIGGLLIGTAAVMFLLFNGRVMGVAGILGRLFDRSSVDSKQEAVAFILGVVGFPLIVSLFKALPATNATHSVVILIIAGICVGLGTRMGSGCTSGHGICGIARFSPRSIVATVTFMATGIITVALMSLAGV